jgi:dihydroorotate dehydrogenase (fumarate)
MADLSVHYMGLTLKNPILAGASGLTGAVDSIKELEAQGAGAIVLKSLFEEQILHEIDGERQGEIAAHAEEDDYLRYFETQHYVGQYLDLVRGAKQAVSIPVIASVNCRTSGPWTEFAKKIEAAGADALEINIFLLPADPLHDGDKTVRTHYEIVKKVRETVKIPVALKIGYHFDNLANVMVGLSHTGIKSLVLFQRAFKPDIDIDAEELIAGDPFTQPADLHISLRWIAILAGQVDCDLCATTGVHDGEAVVKQILAGASAVQMVSTLYRNGTQRIKDSVAFLNDWMDKHHYRTVADFKGKLAQGRLADPTAYQRVQFLKHFGGVEY